MKSFEYAAPKTLKEALGLLNADWGKTEILAGGTDLVTSLKQRVTQPDRVVSLKNIAALKGIHADKNSVRIGAMTTLAELTADKNVQKMFPALVTAVQNIGSPQILSAGTVGGDLCQRPRCWYFRNGFGLLGRQGDASLVAEGENRYHAIFGNRGPAKFVSPASLAPALIALGASVTVTGAGEKQRAVAAVDFFRTPQSEAERETVLKPDEILTEVVLPVKDLRNATYEIRHRHGFDWPYVTAAVALHLRAGKATDATVVLGHVAPVPWSAAAAARALEGAAVNEILAAKAGEAAVEGATPLSGNAYKIQMVKVTVKRAVLAAAAA